MISASLQKTIHAGIRDESARARTSNFLEETKRILSGMDCHGFNREEVQILLVLGTAVVSQTTDASVLSSLTGVGESFIANIFRRIDEEPLLAYLHGGVIHVHDPWQFRQLPVG